jgi:putative transcriptional regulator
MKKVAQTGNLLAAVPDLRDPNFFRSVVLVFQHDQEGAAGLVLNRPLPVAVKEVAREALELESDCLESLFWGGPVEGPLMALHRSADLAELQVTSEIFFSMQKHNLQRLLDRRDHQFRIFTGYAGWGVGQLESELEAGGWLALPAMSEQIFGSPDSLWQAVCEDVGRRIILPRGHLGPEPPAPEWN